MRRVNLYATFVGVFTLISMGERGFAVPPPETGGVLWVYPLTSKGQSCDSVTLRKFPNRSIQYWLSGSSLWRIHVDGVEVRVEAVKFPLKEGGMSEAERIAEIENSGSAGCMLRGQFEMRTLPEVDSIDALFPRVAVGRMRKHDQVWYWARK